MRDRVALGSCRPKLRVENCVRACTGTCIMIMMIMAIMVIVILILIILIKIVIAMQKVRIHIGNDRCPVEARFA